MFDFIQHLIVQLHIILQPGEQWNKMQAQKDIEFHISGKIHTEFLVDEGQGISDKIIHLLRNSTLSVVVPCSF